MSSQRPAGWPSPVYWATIAAAIAGLLVTAAFLWFEYSRAWSYPEKHYLLTILDTIKLEMNPLPHKPDANYILLLAKDAKNQSFLALPDDVVEGLDGDGKPRLFLSDIGQQRGYVKLVWGEVPYVHKDLRKYLAEKIYQNRGVWGYIDRSVYLGLFVFAWCLILAIPSDRKRTRVLREGKRLQGPELVSVKEFNRRHKSDGIAFWIAPRNLLERLFPRYRQLLRIPRRLEAHHSMFIGDTGSGKSSRIREVLCDVQSRGEYAIVYDPHLEYTPLFYRPERGDIILNPLDSRMPYWSPSDEVEHEAEAANIAASLFPEPEGEGKEFFLKGPRRIFAHLLKQKLPPEELARIMGDEKEIDRVVQNTPLSSLVYREAGGQRGAMLAEVTMVVDALNLLPRREETSAVWTAKEWVRNPKGWLFVTSTPETQDAILPITSLLLDMLVLRLLSRSEEDRPVWIVLDELESLRKLSKLHDAITGTRKSGTRVVLGFQGRSQLEARYGPIAEALLSQPATKIFLRTGEPNAAHWISRYIGDVLKEYLKVSYTEGQGPNPRQSKTYHTDKPPASPLVIPSTIQGLEDQEGYVKLGNLVVRATFPYIDLPKRQPGLLLRRKKSATIASNGQEAPQQERTILE